MRSSAVMRVYRTRGFYGLIVEADAYGNLFTLALASCGVVPLPGLLATNKLDSCCVRMLPNILYDVGSR